MMKMKNIAILFSACILFACSTKDITKDISLKVDTDLLTHTAMVEVVDGANVSVHPNATIRLEGDRVDQFYSNSGSSNIELKNGRTVFGLHPRNSPTNASPIEVTMVVEAPGYLPVRKRITFGTETNQIHTITMVNKQNPPNGIGFGLGDFALNEGTLISEASVAVVPENEKDMAMKLTIPAGTEFFDANGEKLQGSSLKVEVGHFDTDDRSSLENFPDGLEPTDVLLPNGQTEDVAFQTAGFTVINMSVNGAEVKTFSEPINVKMQVDPAVINPETGSPLTEGDNIDIWSYTAETGRWEFEMNKSLSYGDILENELKADNLMMEFTTTHLTWYNLDFYTNICEEDRAITFNANITGEVIIRFSSIVNPEQGYRYKAVTVNALQGLTHYFSRTPNSGVAMVAYENWCDAYLGVNAIGNGVISGCNNGELTISKTSPNDEIYLDIEGYCPDEPNLGIRTSFYVYYKKPSEEVFKYLGFVDQGIGTTQKLTLGESYEFAVYYYGWHVSPAVVVDKTEYIHRINIGAEACTN